MRISEAVERNDIERLKQWYQVNGTNSFLKLQLDGDIDEYLAGRLLEEVKKLLPDEKDLKQTPSVSERISQEPEPVQKRFLQARTYFKQMKETRLGIFSEDAEVRKQAALETVRLAKLNKQCWIDIEHYRQYGYLPTSVTLKDQVNAMSVIESVNQLRLDENYVYKHGKRLSTLSGKKHMDLEIELNKRKVRINLIMRKLSNEE